MGRETLLKVGQEVGPFQITKGPFYRKAEMAAAKVKPDPTRKLRREPFFTIVCAGCGQEKKHVYSNRLNGLINDAGYPFLRCHTCYLNNKINYQVLVASTHKPQKKTLR
jgi:hypothetical protein